jgi:uncharacterized short protein YbdD (DUF466 family)
MNPTESSGPAVTRSGAIGASGAGGAQQEVASNKAHGIRQVCMQLFGIPDYERYVAHAKAHHPDAPVLSRREFFAQAIDRKYGKSGPRCC